MVGAIILGIVAGFVGRWLIPNDVIERSLSGWRAFAATVLLGLVGAVVGWVVFTAGLGIGDKDVFDLGGIIGAIVGVVVLLLLAGFIADRLDRKRTTAT
jgi:uncharacterized membrane protein YeaQ/YmgE (transglycosylase-associated protein family)